MREINRGEAYDLYERTKNAWQDPKIPASQWEVNKKEYEAILKLDYDVLDTVPPFVAARKAMHWLYQFDHTRTGSMVDIGASSGFYSELLRHYGFMGPYKALDYSRHFKTFAEKMFPGIDFTVGDAEWLPFEKDSFDIVWHGCCLIHIFNWATVIAEASRVAKKWVVFHRTPLDLNTPTQFFEKDAYGVQCLEVHFNIGEFISICGEQGLILRHMIPVFEGPDFGSYFGHYTMIFEKVA